MEVDKTEKVGFLVGFLNISSQVGITLLRDVDTAKAHVSVWDVSRQPSFLVKVFLNLPFVKISRTLLNSGCKDTLFLSYIQIFNDISTDPLLFFCTTYITEGQARCDSKP